MSTARVLATSNVGAIDRLVSLEDDSQIGLDSSALEVFTDFTRHRPLVIDASTSITDAETLMRRTHVKLKLVVDPAGRFLGTVVLPIAVRLMEAVGPVAWGVARGPFDEEYVVRLILNGT